VAAFTAGLLRGDVLSDRVKVTITIHTGKGWRRGRDLDNLIKPILDWSVRYGLLMDDDWEHVPSVGISVAPQEPQAYASVRYERLEQRSDWQA